MGEKEEGYDYDPPGRPLTPENFQAKLKAEDFIHKDHEDPFWKAEDVLINTEPYYGEEGLQNNAAVNVRRWSNNIVPYTIDSGYDTR